MDSDKPKSEWKCPKCGAPHDGHGKKATEMCDGTGRCQGLICECPVDDPDDDHGMTFDKPCTEANCYHCGWGGSLPVKPKGILPWEKKALEAGWAPPKDWNKTAKPI